MAALLAGFNFSFSLSSHSNSVCLRTDRSSYTGGEVVTGNVYLNVSHHIHDFKGVDLKVKGYEKTKWEEQRTRTNSDNQPETYTVLFDGHHSFFKVKLPLYKMRGSLGPGQYCFPFSFPLPMDLPGVFHEDQHRWGTKYEARTRYKVKVECHGAGKATQDLIIFERPLSAVTPVSGEKTANVMFCCCVNKGVCTLRTHFDKNVYVPGEVCNIVAEVDNQSTVAFTNIVTKLMRSLSLKDHHGNHFHRTECLLESKFPGCEAFQKLLGSDARQVPIALTHSQHGTIQPQTNGKLINCKYWVDVEVAIPWAPDIEIHMPISIFAPAPPEARWQQFDLPPGWAPQRFEVANLAFYPENAY